MVIYLNFFQKFFTCSKRKPWQQDDNLQNFMQPKLQAAIIETIKRTEFAILRKLNGSNFEPSQDHMDIPTCDLGSFDGFLRYPSKIPLTQALRLRVHPVPS